MKKIGIIVAMDKEMELLREVFTGSNVEVVKCGIGKVNAALGTQRMITEFHPDAIISSGCAGGNGKGVSVGDIVVSTETTYHDVYCGESIDSTTVYGQVQGLPARYPTSPLLLEKARVMASAHPEIPLRLGLIATGDWFVDAKEKMRDIVGHFPDAAAVDMESAAIAQTCWLAGVPFISFRIISDIPLSDTNASQYHNFWQTAATNTFQATRTFADLLLATQQ